MVRDPRQTSKCTFMHNEGTKRVSPKSLQKKFSEVTCIDLISYIHEDQLI